MSYPRTLPRKNPEDLVRLEPRTPGLQVKHFTTEPRGTPMFPKQALVFTCLQYNSFENTAGKGEIARNEQFLLFPQCFLPVRRTYYYFHKLWNCRLQTFSVCTSLKFVVWKRVKHWSVVTESNRCYRSNFHTPLERSWPNRGLKRQRPWPPVLYTTDWAIAWAWCSAGRNIS